MMTVRAQLCLIAASALLAAAAGGALASAPAPAGAAGRVRVVLRDPRAAGAPNPPAAIPPSPATPRRVA